MSKMFDDLDILNNKSGSSIEKELINAYKQSLLNVRKKIERIYLENTDINIIMLKSDRLLKLEKFLENELTNLYKTTNKSLIKSLYESYINNYLYIGFIAESNTEIDLSYVLINKEVIATAIQSPIGGITLKDRLIKNKNEILFELKRKITSGLLEGLSYAEVNKNIKELFNNDANKSIRIVRTEMHRIQSLAKEESYKHIMSNGIDIKKVWVSTLDLRTRDTHRKLDGQVADSDGYFHSGHYKSKHPSGFGVASEDINCRCTTIVRDFELKPSDVRIDSEKKKIIKYSTYQDWYKNRVK